jgi:ubiquinone biosynthesis protein
LSKRYQNISRYQEIGVILIKHGFGYLVQQIGFKDVVFWRALLSASYKKPIVNLTLPERIRYLFEDLGPTFIKLGQLLSTRPDLIPEEYITSLEKLQDKVETIEAHIIKEQIVKSLRKRPEEIFAYFENEPLASASIGQVHRAVLVTGEEVVVKVQKPLIRDIIQRDLGILKDLAGVLKEKTPLGQVCDVQEIIEIISRYIKRELDYYIEGANTEGFCNIFKDYPQIKVPKVYWEYTTREVIVFEYLRGKRISEIYDSPMDPRQKEILAATLLDFIIMPFFKYGLFHGDPHPGNLIYTEDGALGVIDFGIIGRIDPNFRKYMAQLMIAMMRRDVLSTIDIIMKTGEVVGKVNQQYLYEDIAELVDQATGAICGDVSFANIINDMITISLRHGILMPTAFFNLGKAFIVSEGIARRIYPTINILKVAQPTAIEFMQKEMLPDFSPENVLRKISDTIQIAGEIPFDLSKAIKNIADGETRVTFYHRNLNWLYHTLKQSTIRICISLIIAALLVGSALIMHTGKGALLWGFPIIGLAGFSFATFIGILLTVHMFRSLN